MNKTKEINNTCTNTV